jgi:hypothetical protein
MDFLAFIIYEYQMIYEVVIWLPRHNQSMVPYSSITGRRNTVLHSDYDETWAMKDLPLE